MQLKACYFFNNYDSGIQTVLGLALPEPTSNEFALAYIEKDLLNITRPKILISYIDFTDCHTIEKEECNLDPIKLIQLWLNHFGKRIPYSALNAFEEVAQEPYRAELIPFVQEVIAEKRKPSNLNRQVIESLHNLSLNSQAGEKILALIADKDKRSKESDIF